MEIRHFKTAALAMVLLVVMGGCASLPPIPADKDLLSITAAGTSREAVLLKLGEPSASFEQGRILTYRIGSDDEKGYFLLGKVFWGRC